jgi:hypothetical protein
MTSTVEKLASYRRAIEKWKGQKDRMDLAEKEGRKNKKQLDPEPSPISYGLAADDFYAGKIRAEVLAKVPFGLMSPVLEEKKIKMPVRKIV